MAFFLLGRVGDTLNMLCPGTFDTRQDALAALSRVTAEPDFDQWDAEVLLLDTDAGTPVLLVRPHSDAGAPVLVSEPVEELEVIVVDELDEPIADEVLPTTDDIEPVAVGDAAIADAIVEEYEEENEEENEPDAVSALKDALTRTAVQMESEGIFAPESIGSPTVTAETEVESEPEPETEPESDIETEPESQPESEPETQPEAESETEPETQSEAVLESELDTELELEPVSLEPAFEAVFSDEPAAEDALPDASAEVAPSEVTEASDSGWPWDVASENATPDLSMPPEIAYVLSDLEEPSLDDGSILRGSIDDETFAAARPVIMGSYGEPAETIGDVQPDVVVAPMGAMDTVHVPSAPQDFDVPVVGDSGDVFLIEPETAEQSEATAETLPPVELLAEDSLVVELDSNISDFILDLGTVQSDEGVAPSPDASGLDEYTCGDCVYDETCPNKDQRLPKDCGSFQWR